MREKSSQLATNSIEVQSLNSKLESQAQEYQSNLNALKLSNLTEIDKLQQKNESLNNRLEAHLRELELNAVSLEKKVSELEYLKSDFEKKSKESEESVQRYREQLVSLQAQISSQESSDSNLKNLNQNLMLSLKESREKLGANATEIKTLKVRWLIYYLADSLSLNLYFYLCFLFFVLILT